MRRAPPTSRAVGLALAAGLVACAAPDTDDAFTNLTLDVADDGAAANALFAQIVDQADATLKVALPTLTDPMLADALVAAADRGVEVELVVDIDASDTPEIDAVRAAGAGFRGANAGLGYFDFNINGDVAWSSDLVRMTHSFVIADRTRLAMATAAGDTGGGTRFVWSGRSEDLGDDLTIEHNQVFGGTDAAAVTAFDAPAKSIADNRWAYWTQSADIFQLWLGPQERIVKRMIDTVYSARGPIRLMADDIADEGLALALQEKAADGFDVEVIVGPGFGTSSSALSEVLIEQAPDVTLLRQDTQGPLPTLLMVDFGPARDGRRYMPRALVPTIPVWSAARLYGGREVLTEQLADAALYVLHTNGLPTVAQVELATRYDDARLDAVEVR